MKHYQMLPQDTIRILPPDFDNPAYIELMCERTMIFFRLDELTDVSLREHVRVDKTFEDALSFTGKDALFGAEYLVLLPAEEAATDVVILEVEPVDEETENYLSVQDEALLNAVYDIFKEKYKDVLTFEEE